MQAHTSQQQHRWAYTGAAVFTLLFGVATAALAAHWAFNVEVDPEDSRWPSVVLMASLSSICFVAGIGGLRNRRWAALPMSAIAVLVGYSLGFLIVPIGLALATIAGAYAGRPSAA